MKAFNISKQSSEKAPKEWEKIPLIHEAKPKDNSAILQKLIGINICVWLIETNLGIYKDASDYFYIEEQ